ncbi:hypothetical protein PSENEW3_00004813 [Picochlorum sp. SENEW3]|nr:hypothetical protein PSENEW3_00004813 [Picochlorum sp. SENEW3]
MDGRRREYRAVGAEYQPGAGSSTWRIGNIAVYLFMAITLIWLSVLTVDRASSVPPLEHNINNAAIHIPEESKTIKKEEERVQIPVKQPEATTMKKTFIRFQEPGMTFLDAIKTCETFNCLREAHLLPKGNATYNFPHFIIAGYSKSATTSLYRYLNTHPAFMNPKKKEPALFTNRCDFTGKKMFCPPYRVKEYIETILKRDKFVKSGGNVIMFEATPRIFDLGPDLAEILYDLMPWLKLVASLREPISRSISKYVMFKEKFNKGCFVDKPLDWLSVLTLERTEAVGRYMSTSFTEDTESKSRLEDAPAKNAKPTFDTSIRTVQEDETKYITRGKNMTWRFPRDLPFLEALPTCETLKCVRDAHLQPRGDARFNFPHFIIAGYSKSASTSLYKYLIHHPEIVVPKVKEAGLFTDRCSFEGKRMDCPDERVREYIQDFLRSNAFSQKSHGQRAVFEATPRIMDLGPVFAETMYDLMPWVRLISSMREPISRSISKYVMLWDKQIDSCMTNNTLTYCLTRDKTPIMGNPKKSYYSHPLKAWLDNFPKEQLHLVQYEDLVGERQSEELIRLKEFIGVSVDGLPNELDFGDANCRHCRIQPEGWPMKETVYRRLIEKVKPDVLELVRLIDRYGMGNGTRWYQNWERVWNENLKSCKDGICSIQLS